MEGAPNRAVKIAQKINMNSYIYQEHTKIVKLSFKKLYCVTT